MVFVAALPVLLFLFVFECKTSMYVNAAINNITAIIIGNILFFNILD